MIHLNQRGKAAQRRAGDVEPGAENTRATLRELGECDTERTRTQRSTRTRCQNPAVSCRTRLGSRQASSDLPAVHRRTSRMSVQEPRLQTPHEAHLVRSSRRPDRSARHARFCPNPPNGVLADAQPVEGHGLRLLGHEELRELGLHVRGVPTCALAQHVHPMSTIASTAPQWREQHDSKCPVTRV